MAFARASSMRGALRGFQPARASLARSQFWRQATRRSYASGGHEHAKAGSDLPWAIGAIVVTVPSCWYLLQDSSGGAHDAGHGGGHEKEHHEEHHEEHHDEHHEEKSKEEPAEEPKDDSESEKSESGDDAKDADTPDASDDEGDDKKDDKKTEGSE